MQPPAGIDDIFLEAAQILSPADRAAYLDRACAGDLQQRERIERLLRAQPHLSGFLESAAPPWSATVTHIAQAERLGTSIGPYKLREVLGEGGMGIVYAAEQEQPIRRRVALKVIKPGMDSKEIIGRFSAERQALALMDYPNIAKVLDAGTTESGRPYFVMELVRGLPITEYCDRAKLPLRERLKLFITVCQAIQHAHQKGIIHRDLKPSNVMITLHDGTPVPKVIDFGVAKALNQRLTEQTVYTKVHSLVGTPVYMSPEQAEFSGLDVDTRSDVYALGTLLYELLTGHTPFDKERFLKAGYDELRRIIREDEPPRPSQRVNTLKAADSTTVSARRGIDARKLQSTLHGELDWIVMKALEKDRNRRYESASAFAADVERYLDGEAVEACPPSAGYRMKKFVRRNSVALVTTGLVAVALLVGTGVSVWQMFRALDAERKTADALDEVRVQRERARRAVDDMYTQFAEKWLADKGQLTEVKREFLEKALAFYQDMSQEMSSDPKVRYETIEALLRVSRIESGFGEIAKAKETLQQAFSRSKELTSEFPNRPEFQLQLGKIHLYRADSFTGEDAKQEVILANGILPHLRDAFCDVDQRKTLARALARLGLDLTDNRLFPEGTSATGMALEVWESLVKDDPANFDCRMGLAEAYHSKGLQNMSEAGQTDFEQAEAALREAERRFTELKQERPRDHRLRQELSRALLHLAIVFKWTERSKEAEEVERRNVELLRELAREFPDETHFLSLYGIALTNLASDGDNESINLCNEAASVYERLAKRFPKVRGHSIGLMRSLGRLSYLLRAKSRYGEAQQAGERSVALARENLQLQPDSKRRKFEFDASLQLQAMNLIEIGDHAGAAACLDEAASIPDLLSVALKRVEGEDNLVLQIDRIETLFYNSLLLVECIARAEQDQSLTPAQREETCRIYRDKSADWQRRAVDAIPGVLREPNWESGELVLSVFAPFDRFIEEPIDPSTLSPRDRRVTDAARALTMKAFIRELLNQAENTISFYMLANLLTAAPENYRDAELAREVAKRAEAADPQHNSCQDALGWALYRTGDWQSAAETLSKLKAEGECQPLPVLAMCYWKLGELEKARVTLEAARTSVKEYGQRIAEAKEKGWVLTPTLPMCQRLLAEAEAMIVASPSDGPADALEAVQSTEKASKTLPE